MIVVPIDVARVGQNKVLEATEMVKPPVVTSMGLVFIDADEGREVPVADEAEGFTEKLSSVLEGKVPDLGRNAREKVCREFRWESSLPMLDRWMVKTTGSGGTLQ